MATAYADPLTASDRAADVVGRAAHGAHEVRLLETLAADAIEDGVRAARRGMTRGARTFEDFRETAAYRIRKAPFLAVTIAAGIGLLFGAVCSRSGRCASHQKLHTDQRS